MAGESLREVGPPEWFNSRHSCVLMRHGKVFPGSISCSYIVLRCSHDSDPDQKCRFVASTVNARFATNSWRTSRQSTQGCSQATNRCVCARARIEEPRARLPNLENSDATASSNQLPVSPHDRLTRPFTYSTSRSPTHPVSDSHRPKAMRATVAHKSQTINVLVVH